MKLACFKQGGGNRDPGHVLYKLTAGWEVASLTNPFVFLPYNKWLGIWEYVLRRVEVHLGCPVGVPPPHRCQV